MPIDNRKLLWRYAAFGFVFGLIAAGVNLLLALFLNTYISLDAFGTAVLAVIVSRTLISEHAERGEKPRLRAIVPPVLAVTVPYLLPQVPVLWLLMENWRRLLFYDLSLVGLMTIGVWLYVPLTNAERAWRRALTRTRSPETVLRYPRLYPYVGILGTVFFLGLLILSNTAGKNDTVTWWTNAVFGGFVLLGLVIIIAYFKERYYVSEEGVSYVPPVGLGPRRFLRWEDVARVDYSPVWQWIILETIDGRKARIPILVNNGNVFLSLLRQHVSPEARVTPRAREMLGMKG